MQSKNKRTNTQLYSKHILHKNKYVRDYKMMNITYILNIFLVCVIPCPNLKSILNWWFEFCACLDSDSKRHDSVSLPLPLMCSFMQLYFHRNFPFLCQERKQRNTSSTRLNLQVPDTFLRPTSHLPTLHWENVSQSEYRILLPRCCKQYIYCTFKTGHNSEVCVCCARAFYISKWKCLKDETAFTN